MGSNAVKTIVNGYFADEFNELERLINLLNKVRFDSPDLDVELRWAAIAGIEQRIKSLRQQIGESFSRLGEGTLTEEIGVRATPLHLWEAEHAYYCWQGQYTETHKSFNRFLEEWNGADKDLNLLIRWDWQKDDDNPAYNQLRLYYLLQRKGTITDVIVTVTEDDEAAVKEFLKPHWEHLKSLWSPIA